MTRLALLPKRSTAKSSTAFGPRPNRLNSVRIAGASGERFSASMRALVVRRRCDGLRLRTGRSRITRPNSLPSSPTALGRAQVDGHHRAHGRAVDVDAASLQVGAQRAGHGRDEHVVDLGAERRADGLDVVERDGFRPRDPLLHAERALERRLGVRRLEELGRQHRDAVEDSRGLRERLLRMHDRVERGFAEPGKGISRRARDGVQRRARARRPSARRRRTRRAPSRAAATRRRRGSRRTGAGSPPSSRSRRPGSDGCG